MAEPFGNSSPVTNPVGVGDFVLNLRMPGQYFDAETGLSYNWHREYDGSVGRYASSDPVGLSGGDFGLYNYAGGDPVSRIDPTGLLDEGPGGGGGDWPQGRCKLVAQTPVVPPVGLGIGAGAYQLTMCVYRCETMECPLKVWHEVDYSTWKWGCQDNRPSKPPRGREGPRR